MLPLVGKHLIVCVCVCVLSQRSLPVSGHSMQHVNDPGLPGRDPLLFIDSESSRSYLFMQQIQVQIAPRQAVAAPANMCTFRDDLTVTSFPMPVESVHFASLVVDYVVLYVEGERTASATL